MSITAVNKVAAGLTTPTATTNTASWTPTANRLYLASLFQNGNVVMTNAASMTGNGLTWVQVATLQFATGNRGRITVLRALGASPTTGASTITWNTTPDEGGVWTIDEFDGIDTSGTNGSGAIVQSVTGTYASAAASATLAAITAGNASWGAFANESANGATANTVGSGYTKLGESFHTTSPDFDGHLMSEYKAAQTTVNCTAGDFFTGGGIIAIEIKAAPTGTQNALAWLTA